MTSGASDQRSVAVMRSLYISVHCDIVLSLMMMIDVLGSSLYVVISSNKKKKVLVVKRDIYFYVHVIYIRLCFFIIFDQCQKFYIGVLINHGLDYGMTNNICDALQ